MLLQSAQVSFLWGVSCATPVLKKLGVALKAKDIHF
jgi:hypothetical protein